MLPYNRLAEDPSLPVTNPTTSYWQCPPDEKLLGIQTKQLPTQCDVAVIGSGVSACSVVKHLLNSDFQGRVVVLEAREVCSGATGRNGGRLHVHAVQEFDRFRQMYGDEHAKKIVRFQLAHYDEMETVAKALGPEAYKRSAIRQTESVVAVFSDRKFEELRSLHAAFEGAFPDMIGRWRIVEADEAQGNFGIPHAKGAMIGVAGAAWPYRFIAGVYNKLLEDYGDRLSIETSTPVLAVKKSSQGGYSYCLSTPRGDLQSKHVVYCTEAHTAHLLPKLRGIIVPRRGNMSAQKPGAAFGGLQCKRSWNLVYEVGHDYFHQNPSTGDVLLGGGDLGGIDSGLDAFGVTSDAAESMATKSHLFGVLPALFGKDAWNEQSLGHDRVKASWSGVMGYSLDHVPLVGPVPREVLQARSCGDKTTGAEWICAGFGGFGMTNAWLCGKALALQLTGQGVPSWLPEPYSITPRRIYQLQKRVAEIVGTKEHLRALM